jgi:hypothetical protein
MEAQSSVPNYKQKPTHITYTSLRLVLINTLLNGISCTGGITTRLM